MPTKQPKRTRAPRLAPDARRKSILDAAIDMFTERGAAFTMADLAEVVGVSEATVFRYFPDKGSLMAATREAILGLDTLLPQLEDAAELPTLIQRLAAAGHALAPRIERMARLLQNLEVKDRTDAGMLIGLIDALVPLFGEDDTGLTSEQLAGLFLGTMMTNAAVGAKAGLEPIPVDRLVDVMLHGIARRDG